MKYIVKNGKSQAQLMRQAPDEKKAAFAKYLADNPGQALALQYQWDYWARPEQVPPTGGDWNWYLYLGGRGSGKLQCLQTLIPTPFGYRKLGDLGVGDSVYDESGAPCKITAVHDGMPDRAYRFHFSDGAYVDCCSEHQWVTWTHRDRKAFLRSEHEADKTRFPEDWPNWRCRTAESGGRNLSEDELAVLRAAASMIRDGASIYRAEKSHGLTSGRLKRFLDNGEAGRTRAVRVVDGAPGPRVRTSQDIVDTFTYGKRGDTNHCIPTCGALQYSTKDLLVPPYVLGYWLGNGASAAGMITSWGASGDLAFVVNKFSALGVQCREGSDKRGNTITTKGLTTKLRHLGVINNKHVPQQYLLGDVEQRLELLRGLLDSDGWCSDSKVEFCSMRKCLADAVFELAASLGQKPVMRFGRAMLNGEDYGEKYRVCWTATMQVFSLPRKAKEVVLGKPQSLRNHHRMITSYEEIDPTPMRCLTVDSPNSMFLCTQWCIPTHNTRAAAEWVRSEIESGRRNNLALLCKDPSDGRNVMIEGPAGLIAISPPKMRPHYEVTKKKVFWPNGAEATIYSAEDPDGIRGGNHDGAWVDELCAFRHAEESMMNLEMTMRKKANDGSPARGYISTTPKPTLYLNSLLANERTIVAKGSTFDNLDNLDPSFIELMRSKYEGTTMGRQELYAEILNDTDGAMFTAVTLDKFRVKQPPELKRIVCAIDPQGRKDAKDKNRRYSSETGIIVAGEGRDGHAYILDDLSGNYHPEEWARKAVGTISSHDVDLIVAEVNKGGEMVKYTIETIDKNTPLKLIKASKGKQSRSEPIAALAEQGKIHMVGYFPDLEMQLTTYTGADNEPSPDRMDAMVWALSELMLGKVYSPTAVTIPTVGYRGGNSWSGI